MTIRKNQFPKILYATIDSEDPEFVHLVTDDEMADVVCKGTKKVAIYKLERVEKFNWDEWADDRA